MARARFANCCFLSCRLVFLALGALWLSLVVVSQVSVEEGVGEGGLLEGMSEDYARALLRNPKELVGNKDLHERVVSSALQRDDVLALDFFLFKLPGVKRKLLKQSDLDVVGKLLASNEIQWKKVLVQFNHMGDKGIAHLAQGLALNKFVESLYLEGNDLTDACTNELFDALEANGRLKMIHIDFNAFSDASIPRMLQFMERSKTLKLFDVSFNKFSKEGKATLKSFSKRHNVSVWAHMTAPF